MIVTIPSLGPFRRIGKIDLKYEINGIVRSAYVSNYYSPSLNFYTGYYILYVVYFKNPVDVALFNVAKLISRKNSIYTLTAYGEVTLPINELDVEISFTGLAMTHGCDIPDHSREVAVRYASDSVNKTMTFKLR